MRITLFIKILNLKKKLTKIDLQFIRTIFKRQNKKAKTMGSNMYEVKHK